MNISALKKVNPILLFIICVGGTLILGFLSGLISGATAGYTNYTRPALTPPDIVFSIVWPVLYFMMGTSLYIAIKNAEDNKTLCWFVGLYVFQLVLNLVWPFIFFSKNKFAPDKIKCAICRYEKCNCRMSH